MEVQGTIITVAIGLFVTGILLLCIAGVSLVVERRQSAQCGNSVGKKQKEKVVEDVNLNVLDLQFSQENNPIVIYRDMFTRSAPWIGGYDIAIGKTIIRKESK